MHFLTSQLMKKKQTQNLFSIQKLLQKVPECGGEVEVCSRAGGQVARCSIGQGVRHSAFGLVAKKLVGQLPATALLQLSFTKKQPKKQSSFVL